MFHYFIAGWFPV